DSGGGAGVPASRRPVARLPCHQRHGGRLVTRPRRDDARQPGRQPEGVGVDPLPPHPSAPDPTHAPPRPRRQRGDGGGRQGRGRQPGAGVIASPDIDLLSGELFGDVARAAYAWMRREAPVYFDERNRLWGVATYDGVLAASRDAVTFSNAGGSRPKTGPMPWMIDMDGTDHLTRRKLVSRGFTPARVRGSAARVEGICDDLIDGVCERGECDVVRDLAAPLPMIVIGDMLGVAPADRDRLLSWSDDLIGSLGGTPERLEAAAAAFVEYDAYARRTIAARRHDPTDDLVSVLVHADVDGDRLTDDQIVFESLLILVGGDETTRHVISGGMEQLLLHPSERHRIDDEPSLLPSAVEEMSRWVSP